ncbi:MAG: hypothetical protein QGG40_08335, partial [Myxococcota bacterium]|nr:hypothetical protein [Myxococcota bacterium]
GLSDRPEFGEKVAKSRRALGYGRPSSALCGSLGGRAGDHCLAAIVQGQSFEWAEKEPWPDRFRHLRDLWKRRGEIDEGGVQPAHRVAPGSLHGAQERGQTLSPRGGERSVPPESGGMQVGDHGGGLYYPVSGGEPTRSQEASSAGFSSESRREIPRVDGRLPSEPASAGTGSAHHESRRMKVGDHGGSLYYPVSGVKPEQGQGSSMPGGGMKEAGSSSELPTSPVPPSSLPSSGVGSGSSDPPPGASSIPLDPE